MPNKMTKQLAITCLIFLISGCDILTGPTATKSSSRAMTSFSLVSPAETGLISGQNIALTVPHGTLITSLVATFQTTGVKTTVKGTGQVSGTTANDFSSPVIYTVWAEDGSTSDYTVTIQVAPSTTKDILTFGFDTPATTASITGQSISLLVPYGTNLSALVPSFTTNASQILVGTTVQTSGITANNFSSPLTYTAVAADGSSQEYTVTVAIQKNPAKQLLTFGFPDLPLASGVISNSTISVTLPYQTALTALRPVFTTTGKTVTIAGTQLVSGTVSDLTNATVLTVQAEDGTSQVYNLNLTVSTTPEAFVSLKLTNFPLADGSSLNWAGNFLTDPWSNSVTRLLNVVNGQAFFGESAPVRITSPDFEFTLITPNSNWVRPWFISSSHEATNATNGSYMNWQLDIPLDGKIHPISVDGSTAIMVATDTTSSQLLYPYASGVPLHKLLDNMQVPVGSPMVDKTIQLKNAGTTAIAFDNTSLTFSNPSFSLVGSLPAVVQPGGSFDFTFSYRGTSLALESCDLTFNTAAGARYLKLSVSGQKLFAPLPVPSTLGIMGSVVGFWTPDAFFLGKSGQTFTAIAKLQSGEFLFRGNSNWSFVYKGDGSSALGVYNGVQMNQYPLINGGFTNYSNSETANSVFIRLDFATQKLYTVPVTSIKLNGTIALTNSPGTDNWTTSADLTGLTNLYFVLNDDTAFKLAPNQTTNILDFNETYTNSQTGTHIITITGRNMTFSVN